MSGSLLFTRFIYSKAIEKVDLKCNPRALVQRESVHMALNFLRETSALDFETQVH